MNLASPVLAKLREAWSGLLLGPWIIVGLLSASVTSCTNPEDNNGGSNVTHSYRWTLDTVGYFQSRLFDVWGVNSEDVYAVGFVYRDVELNNRTNVLKWNGQSWASVDYLEGDVYAVRGFGIDKIWIGGLYQIDQSLFALLGYNDGGAWQTTKLPMYSTIFSIWGTAANNLFAAGESGRILKFDGHQWTQEDSVTAIRLYDISGTTDGSLVLSVGASIDSDVGSLLRKVNGSWTKVSESPPIGGSPSGSMKALWNVTADQFYLAAGSKLFRGNGFDWSPVDVSSEGREILDIKGSSGDNVFACGASSLLLHYNGESWHRYNELDTLLAGATLTGVWCNSNQVFVVGYTLGSGAFILRGVQIAVE